MIKQHIMQPPEPWPTVLIIQWNAAGHLFNIVRRVVFIAFDIRPTQMLSQQSADSSFAAAGDTHHNERSEIFIQIYSVLIVNIMSNFRILMINNVYKKSRAEIPGIYA
jgi:hypothetical protein